MNIVVILNVNTDINSNAKICYNREYTRHELKSILIDGFSGFFEDIVFYDNFMLFMKESF